MNKQIKPLTPKECLGEKELSPLMFTMIDAVNKLLIKNYTGHGSVTLKQEDIIQKFLELENLNSSSTLPFERKRIFEEKLLDFEFIFRKYGWSVTYDGPGYNESYKPTYEFKPIKS